MKTMTNAFNIRCRISKEIRGLHLTKTIETLTKDLDNLLETGYEVSDEQAKEFGDAMAKLLQTRLKRDKKGGTLRMSNLGKPNRQLWYEVNVPHEAEKLHPNSYLKFLYGDVIEELLITLVKLTGHKVEGQQDVMDLHGIKGSRDVVIDVELVDVKSASPFSYQKFKKGLKKDEDPFGYHQQIQNYLHASDSDDIVTTKERAHFLVMNKVTGDVCLDTHDKSKYPIEDIIQFKKQMVSNPEPPERCFEPVPIGKSGNLELGLNCSYCSYKKVCYPSLRIFAYSSGPKFLVHVEEEPKVPEITVEN